MIHPRFLIVLGITLFLPDPGWAYINAGFRSHGEYQEHLKKQERAQQEAEERRQRRLDEAIRGTERFCYPVSAADYYDRANLCRAEGALHRAVEDYTEALRHADFFPEALVARGEVQWMRMEYDRAIADYQAAIRQVEATGSRAVVPHLHLAAAYAALPGVRFHDLAIETAARACERTGYQDADAVQVLAALHAVNGASATAAKLQTTVLAQFPTAAGAERRLELYRQGRIAWAFDAVLTGPAVPIARRR